MKQRTFDLRYILILVLATTSVSAWSQSADQSFKKGQAYLHWGWNRAFYTRSDISFKGPDYNFELLDVRAHDRPTLPITVKRYIKNFFNPQTNYKAGYFIADNLALSFGVDHMKYVMDQGQYVTMKGDITRENRFKGSYNGPMPITGDFLAYEHTNGLNYINFEIEKYAPLYDSRSGRVHFRWMYAGGAGILFPKSDVKLMDYKENNQFHVAGFGASLKAGVSAIFFHHLFWRLETKGGYIDMPSVLVNNPGIDGRAKQHFFFWETDTNIGFTANLGHRKANPRSHEGGSR